MALDVVLYNTMTVCPACFVLERKEMELLPAEVIDSNGKIWIALKYDNMPMPPVFVDFQMRFAWQTKDPLQQVQNLVQACSRVFTGEGYRHITRCRTDLQDINVTDIEDLKKKAAPTPTKKPLAIELNLYPQTNTFLSDVEIEDTIAKAEKTYVADQSRFILRLIANLCDDMETLNKKILHVLASTKLSEPIVVQLTYERLLALCKFSDSCFLQNRIYPAVKYFVDSGSERQCIKELELLFGGLKEFEGLKMAVTLSIEPPFPNLTNMLTFLRKECGFVRLIEIQTDRSPSQLVKSLKEAFAEDEPQDEMMNPLMDDWKPPRDPNEPREVLGAIDMSDVIRHLSLNSHGTIKETVSMGHVLEPFLDLMGWGKFTVKPSPLCGFGVCLLNNASFTSVPISQLINFEKFYQGMQPLMPKIRAKGIGFWIGRSIKKVLKSASSIKLPDLLDYVIDSGKKKEMQDFVSNMQFLLIHNHMDIAVLDVTRRCQCSVMSLDANGKMIAACNGCL